MTRYNDETLYDEPQEGRACPKCGEFTHSLDINYQMCEGCVEAQLEDELSAIKAHRQRGETLSAWVARCNDVLSEYGYERDHEYCPRCEAPTRFDDLCNEHGYLVRECIECCVYNTGDFNGVDDV